MSTLPLNTDVNVIINLSPLASPRNAFNLGLIIGDTAVISAGDRAKEFASLEEMITEGFAITDPEYLAAQLYFSQKPQPTRVLIGRQDSLETPVQAVTACRIANNEWYSCLVCGATKTEIEALAAYVESASPSTVLFATTADADVPTGTAGNILKTLKAAGYQRTLIMYSTDGDAAAAIMGYAMGANTGLINSSYTLKFKKCVGVTPEALTTAQVSAIEGDNGNIYVNRGSYYNMFEQGVMADGTFFDEILNLDKLANDIQLNVMDVLYGNSKVPQTEGGVGMIRSAIISANEQAKSIGFVAPGKWTGPNILGLSTGDTLPQGYVILSDSIDAQAPADREARKSPPIYNCIKLAGAVHSVIIQVNVNR
ncbi:MAG: hypothetical protein UT13_C0002G0008 [Candidatus Pacebacteria bacterium GW2011_GWF2_38_9]|nr:MAG: hypothetical protein UT13_C0002G0008 [Candidatus Pacebacteria bacterium GW2011_GWF2_38_9]